MSVARQATQEKFVSNAGGGAALGLQCIASTAGTVIGQALGSSIIAKLLAGALLTIVGAFLTAPGRHHRRRVVAVALLLALLHALRQAAAALASSRRTTSRRRPRPQSASSAWVPASWAAIGLTAVVGFALGSGVTTARGGWTDEKGNNGEPKLTIPDVRGQTKAVAARTLLTEGFRVRLWTERAGAPKRIALRTEPPAGSRAEKRSIVKLIVSSGPKGKSGPAPALGPGPRPGPGPGPGPTKIAIPPVKGLPEAAARGKLRAAGFDVTTSSESSESIPESTAVRTDPSAGIRVRKGSPVKLIVSSGPAFTLIEVPDVAGMNSKEALSTLRRAQLIPSIVHEESESRAGTVIVTSPPAGERIPEGSLVKLLVSSGTARTVSCKDFADQEEAQRFFEEHSEPEERDPYGLDPDENGIACG